MSKNNKIIPMTENFAEWYTSVINNAELFMYGSVKGTMILQPNGWAIWEMIQKYINIEFKKIGVQNVSLPFLIPLSEFEIEKDHVEGFAPELYTVTKIGKKEIDSPLVIRPTSEVSFCRYFAYIISSYKNLPIKLNQWCSVMRAEKTTRPFLRNTEFHWQEMHSIHETPEDAILFTKTLIDLYEEFVTKILCIPVIKGEKTEGERFAGASNTFTIEALMQDGQMLQCATSHFLNQTFSKPYNIKFQNRNNTFDYVYQTSAGISTRIIGALIMVHSDDNGLVLPLKIAPNQIIINAINYENNKIAELCLNLEKKLVDNGYRVIVDKTEKSFGLKMTEGEYKGYPIQIIIGNKTLIDNNVTIYRRDLREKFDTNVKDVLSNIDNIFKTFDFNLFNRAKSQLSHSVVQVNNIDELNKTLKDKNIAKAYWSGTKDDETKIKELTGATPRCIIQTNAKEGKCFFTNKTSNQIVIFGRAY